MGGVAAQTQPIEFEFGEFQSYFPHGIVAYLNVTSTQQLGSATFFLTMNGNTLFTDEVDVSSHLAGESMVLAGRWAGMINSGEPTPPWARLQIWWQLVDVQGNAISTPIVREVYQDTRHLWQETAGAYVRVYTYHAFTEYAALAARRGDEAMMALRDVYGFELSYRPTIVFYSTTVEGAFDLGVNGWEPFGNGIGGRAYPQTNTVIILGIPNADFIEQAVIHEIAHLYQFNMGTIFFDAFDWWIEGDAAAHEPLAAQQATLKYVYEYALTQQLPYLPAWADTPTAPDAIDHVTAMGASFVLFLLDTYGVEQYQQFYENWGHSKDFYHAFVLTYGVSLPQLDLAWRVWVRQIPKFIS